MTATSSISTHVRNLLALTFVLMTTVAAMSQTQPTTSQPAAKPAPPATAPAEDAKPVYVLMNTSKGEIVLELDPVRAPVTVANFVAYVDKGFYDGTIFHRVIANFMIQGGGFTSDMKEKDTDPPIKNEWRNGLKNARGTISMARLGGNPDSASSQFFINVTDNAMLDSPQPDGAAYAVFGKVIAGMKVADAIRYVQTGRHGGHADVPAQPVIIEKVTRITADEAKAKVEADKPKPAPPPATKPAG